jgi:cell division protease FtsH
MSENNNSNNSGNNNNPNNFFNNNPLLAFALFAIVIIVIFKLMIGDGGNIGSVINGNNVQQTKQVKYSEVKKAIF